MGTVYCKPKLTFFQYKYDENLPDFLLTHKTDHVTCLSQFFEVTVINEDCDYQYICDKYQPELTLFESGLNIQTCRKPTITNTHTCPEIPKVGLFNADSWSETRAGTLSEMERWGIETFFSISTTIADHVPEIVDNLFVWPNFIDPDMFRDYGHSKLITVLLTGSKGPHYPWRRNIYKLVSEHYPSLSCPHGGYLARSGPEQLIHGEQYARMINASLVTPACGTIAKEIVRKHFEVPGCRSCLITEQSPMLQAAGFIDMKNCVFADKHDVLDKLDHLFRHPEELHAITDGGYQVVHSRHTLKHRDQLLQWLELRKTLTSTQKIVQPNPFDNLAVVDKASETRTYQIRSEGSHLELLRQGDAKLWAGKYDEAEGFYRRCLNHMRRLPEAKVRLAICSLYKGDAKMARERVADPIQYVLADYKAIDPDPVEWAYYIISSLCLGKVEYARKCAKRFPWLEHPELDRARWAVKIVTGRGSTVPLQRTGDPKHRPSIHSLPHWSTMEWVEQVSFMLKACRQYHLAEMLTAYGSAEALSGQRGQKPPHEGGYNRGTSHNEGLLRRKGVRGFTLERTLRTARRKVGDGVLDVLRQVEMKWGHFLPYSVSERRKGEFCYAVESLMRVEDIRTALVIGADVTEGGTEALLAGALENKNEPCVFCITEKRRVSGLPRALADYPAAKWRGVSSSAPEGLGNLETVIKDIKSANQIDVFDVILIDGSELKHKGGSNDVLSKELASARLVLLDDINGAYNYQHYDRLLRNPDYVVIDQNPSLQEGFAIFRNCRSAAPTIVDAVSSASMLT